MAMQKALAAEFVTVEKNGVKVVMSGDQKIQKFEIDGENNKEAVDALNDVLKEVQKIAAKKMSDQMGGIGGLLSNLGQ